MAPKKQKKLMTQIEASKIIGVSRVAICKGVASGRFKHYKQGNKKLVDVNQIKEVYKLTTKRSGSSSKSKHLKKVNGSSKRIIKDVETGELFDVHDLKLQAERNKVQKEKILLEAALGKYIEIEKVKKEFCSIADNLKKSILAIPDRVGPIVAGESDPHTVRQILINELKNSLQGTVTKKLKEYEREEISNNIS